MIHDITMTPCKSTFLYLVDTEDKKVRLWSFQVAISDLSFTLVTVP